LREGGIERAEMYKSIISNYPIELINSDKELRLNAANIKSKVKLSYAEAFAAGLAKMLDATLLTGDKEFEPLSDKINVEWL